MALDRLRNAIVLDDQPSAPELLGILRQQALSVVLDVSALDPAQHHQYLGSLPAVIEAERAAWGLPHWIVVDEAHVTLAEHGTAADVFRPIDRGYCLVTYRPDQLCAEALAAVDVTITATAAAFPGEDVHTPNATLRESDARERPFTVGARRTPHVRHRHKYALMPLARERWFDFRRPDGTITATAPDIATFNQQLQRVDANVLAYHLERGDFSRWITGVLQDRELAATAGAIERDILSRRAADILHGPFHTANDRKMRKIADSASHPETSEEPGK